MAAIKLSTFKGEIPSYAPSLLPNEASTVAKDCHFDGGVLNPIEENLITGSFVRPQATTLFRYEDNYWLQWDADVDAIKSPIARDPFRRVYWTDGEYPKVTYNTIFNGSGILPASHYKLGVPAPVSPPLVVSFTPPADQESAVTVYYVTTYVTGVGEESSPSPVTLEINAYPIGVEISGTESDLEVTVTLSNGVARFVDKYGRGVDNFSYSSGTISWLEPLPESGIKIVTTAVQQSLTGVDSAKGSYTAVVTSELGKAGEGANNPSGSPSVNMVTDSDGDGAISPSESASATLSTTVSANHSSLVSGGFVTITQSIKMASEVADVGQVVLNLQPPGINNNNIERINIYRISTGAGSAEFLKVANIPISQSSYVDTTPNSGLGEILSTETFTEPPDEMQGLCYMANGICAGFVDNEVLFSEVYLPYAWPEAYRQSIDFDIVAIASIGTSLVVGTKGDPYLYTGISPGNIAGQKIEISQACVSKRSMINTGPAVMYACPDGLVAIAPDGVRLITEGLINPIQWRKMLDPSTIRAYRHEVKYIGIHSTGAFVFDPISMDLRQLSDSWKGGFTDPKDDTLYIINKVTGNVEKFRGGLANKKFTWKSKAYNSISKNFSCCRVECEGDYTFTLIADGESVFSREMLSGNKTFTLPMVRGDKWQFQIESTSSVESVIIATSKQELKL